MSVTYKQHSSFMYNLTPNTREVGDIKTISREQMKRNSFARDQGLAAQAANIEKSPLLLSAARTGSKLRNLHANMGNTSTTGGCGGYGYATARDGEATVDHKYLPDGETLLCFEEMGKITNAKDYILVSQIICKPNACIYARYATEFGVTPVRFPHLLKDIDYMEVINVSEDATTFKVHMTRGQFRESYIRGDMAEGVEDELTIPIVFDADTTYWYIRVYSKVTKKHDLIYVKYSDRPVKRFPGESVVNNYPNVPLSRTTEYSQDYFDTYKGNVQTYPTDEEREAFLDLHQPTFDAIAAEVAEQEAFIESLQPQYDVFFAPIQDATEEQQGNILDNYLDTIVPALDVLGLDHETFTQADLDTWDTLAKTDPVLYADETEALTNIRLSQEYILSAVPNIDTIGLFHSFAGAWPLTLQEEAALNKIGDLQVEKSRILSTAPQSALIHNANYSEWGDETFMHHYPKYYDLLWESFLSEGSPDHAPVKRFLSMVGQRPRAYADAVRAGIQTEAEEGNIGTLCDQLTFGCQVTDNADYAEMRYAIEFARSAWWATMWDEENYLGARDYAEDFQNEYGRSAWSSQHIEETMLNPGHETMKSIRTRWGTCEVWIEEGGEVSNGQFGALSLDQSIAESDWITDVTIHPFYNEWRGRGSMSQTIVATYNIAKGYVLKVKMEGITTQAYSEQGSGKWSTSTSIEHPVLPLFSNVLKSIPVMQVCQMQNEFMFIRTHIGWRQKKSNWVNFRDTKLLKLVGLVITVIGIVLAIPSGGASLSWSAVGTALMYAALYYAAVKVIAHFMEQWGVDKTWIGALIFAVIAVVSMYMGMPPSDSVLLATTMTADAMAQAYTAVNLEEARASAGKLAKLDDALDDLQEKMEEMEEEQHWLDFYSASELVQMRQDAVDYVRNESPDKYYERMMGYQSNMLNLNGVDYNYDYSLDLDLP